MRQIDKRSIYWRDKCINCGCQNKLKRTIFDMCGREVGYTLSCCHCGVTRRFITDDTIRGREMLFDNLVHVRGQGECIMREHCPRIQCKYHPKHNKNKKPHHHLQCDNCKCCDGKVEVEVIPTREYV